MMTYDVKIEGVTPFLYNRFMSSQIDSKTKKRAGATKEMVVEDKLYKDAKGRIYVPSVYIFNSIATAAKSFKIPGKRTATYGKLAGSSIEVSPDELVMSPQDWKPFTVSAVNPMTKGRIMVTRPRLDAWGLSFKLTWPDEDIPVEVVKQIIDHAGQYVGVGDWRPDKKGKYGKFMVTEFKEVAE